MFYSEPNNQILIASVCEDELGNTEICILFFNRLSFCLEWFMNSKTSPVGEWGWLIWTRTLRLRFLTCKFQAKPNPDMCLLLKENFFSQGSGLYCRWNELWFSKAAVQWYRFCSAASVCHWAARSHEASSGETNTSAQLRVLKKKNTYCDFGDINKFRFVCCVTSENASLMNWGNTQNLTLAFWTLHLWQHYRK